jgi:hypothetical protein
LPATVARAATSALPKLEHFGPDFGGPLGFGAEGLADGSYLSVGGVFEGLEAAAAGKAHTASAAGISGAHGVSQLRHPREIVSPSELMAFSIDPDHISGAGGGEPDLGWLQGADTWLTEIVEQAAETSAFGDSLRANQGSGSGPGTGGSDEMGNIVRNEHCLGGGTGKRSSGGAARATRRHIQGRARLGASYRLRSGAASSSTTPVGAQMALVGAQGCDEPPCANEPVPVALRDSNVKDGRDARARRELAMGELEVHILTNKTALEGKVNEAKRKTLMTRLLGVRNLFARGLAAMPRSYITRVVFDVQHKTLALVKNDMVRGWVEYGVGWVQ